MWNILYFDEINSTQTYAKENNLPPYTIITARHQTAGLGQYGRVWEDSQQSVMLTIVLPIPQIPLGLFTQYVALNIIKQLHIYRDDIWIKWPNDLVIKRKKLGGILTEVIDETVYLGVGINITKPIVPTGIGLVDESDEIFYQEVLSCVIAALKQPIIQNMEALESKHVYCQDGVCIQGVHYPNVQITDDGYLAIKGSPMKCFESNQLDMYYE